MRNKVLIFRFIQFGLSVAMFASVIAAFDGIATWNAAAFLVGAFGVVCTSYGVAVVHSQINEWMNL